MTKSTSSFYGLYCASTAVSRNRSKRPIYGQEAYRERDSNLVMIGQSLCVRNATSNSTTGAKKHSGVPDLREQFYSRANYMNTLGRLLNVCV